jgi:hypothetical protein
MGTCPGFNHNGHAHIDIFFDGIRGCRHAGFIRATFGQNSKFHQAFVPLGTRAYGIKDGTAHRRMAMLYQPPNRLAILAVLASIWLFPGLALAPWHSIKMPFQQKKEAGYSQKFCPIP